jgi:hypothetical protein
MPGNPVSRPAPKKVDDEEMDLDMKEMEKFLPMLTESLGSKSMGVVSSYRVLRRHTDNLCSNDLQYLIDQRLQRDLADNVNRRNRST